MNLIIVVSGLIGIIEKDNSYFLLIPKTGPCIHQHEFYLDGISDPVGIDGFFQTLPDPPPLPDGLIDGDPKDCPKYEWVTEDYILRMRKLLASDKGFSVDHLSGQLMPDTLKARIRIPNSNVFGRVYHSKNEFECSKLNLRRNFCLRKKGHYVAESAILLTTLIPEEDGNFYLYYGEGEKYKLDPNDGWQVIHIYHLPPSEDEGTRENHHVSEHHFHENALFNLYHDSDHDHPKMRKRYFATKTKCACKTEPFNDNTRVTGLIKLSESLITSQLDRLACPPYILDEDQ